MALRDRINKLERLAAVGDVIIIIVEGGLPDPEPLTIEIGTQRLEQLPDETGQAFCNKVRCLAVKHRLSGVIVLGGLPDMLEGLIPNKTNDRRFSKGKASALR